MDSIPFQSAEMARDCLAANRFHITSTTRVAGTGTQHHYVQVPQFGESTTAILAAMATTEDICVDIGKATKSGGKRQTRKNRKKALERHIMASTNRVCSHKAIGRRKKKSAKAAASREASKSRSGSGAQSNPKKSRKNKWRARRERKAEERKKRIQSWIDSENKKKGEEVVDGLVGLMQGFGIGAGEKAQGDWMVEDGQEGMDMDTDGIVVMCEDDGEIL